MASRRYVAAAVILSLLFGALGVSFTPVAADIPARLTTIVVSYTEYQWWLMSWDHNMIVCQAFIDHEGLPTVGDIVRECGQEVALSWWTTPPCPDTINCKGLYLFAISSEPKEKEVILKLPPATVWVTLEGCDPVPPENRCVDIPTLVLTGEEPLPDERIVAIQGSIDGLPFGCQDQVCKLPLAATPLFGSRIEFWADSSYGDATEHFTAQVRVIDTGFSAAPGTSGWYVDVFSDQWNGPPIASCTRIWEALPPIGGPPPWLSSPEGFQLLASAEPYYYLAGRMISGGLVDASSCPTGGMLPNGYADACGLEVARPAVEAWQNQFDQRILEVSHTTGVPAQLMKNLFAQESQFWPNIFRVPWELGLGQITDNGAETVLLWNQDFFTQFCPLVLSEDACAGGYLNLGENDQAILRGALALQAKADCSDCAMGVNLSNVNFSVLLFANTLQSNCAQVARTIYTATNSMAGLVSTYEDLWRLTVANYHAGPGCMAFAIHQAWTFSSNGRLTWEDVKNNLTEPCLGVVPYVEKITQ
jgi:hypothetical protein